MKAVLIRIQCKELMNKSVGSSQEKTKQTNPQFNPQKKRTKSVQLGMTKMKSQQTLPREERLLKSTSQICMPIIEEFRRIGEIPRYI